MKSEVPTRGESPVGGLGRDDVVFCMANIARENMAKDILCTGRDQQIGFTGVD